MTTQDRHDAWQAGDRYEAYMGRWSRALAPRFLDWLAAADALDWLEIGCGTGALTSAILDRCKPASLVALDASAGFIATAQSTISDGRAHFLVGDAQSLPQPTASRDVVVSALVLNFIPDRGQALAEMRRVVRPGGLVGFYVWDYPSGGVEFMRAFWDAATALDGRAAELAEGKRFPFCTQDGLAELTKAAGFAVVESAALQIPTVFRDFEDYWTPFTLGAGPAPGYCASLDPEPREALRERLRATLPVKADGTIALDARAWAIKAHTG